MKKLTIILFFISLTSCYKDSSSNSIEEKLRGNGYKYWLFIKSYPSLEKSITDPPEDILYLSYFDQYGKYYDIYRYGLELDVTDERDYSKNSDVDNTHRWSIKNDSVLIINNIDYIIKQLENDIMILRNPRTEVDQLYILAPNSLLPPRYHCIQK